MTDIDISLPNCWILLEKYSAACCGLTIQLGNTFETVGVLIQNRTDFLKGFKFKTPWEIVL